jgi:nucleotide-binding universal stress UspA family protein
MADNNDNPLKLHNKLIVGFDGSDSSVAALRWAAGEATSRKASVTVIASFATSPALSYGLGLGYGGVTAATAADELAEWTRTDLANRALEVFADHPGVGHDYHAVATRPGSALVGAGENADLVVVGRSGAGALGRLLLGSVTSEVIAHNTCPVAVIPETPSTTGGSVVVGTDGSDHAAQAVRWAVDEADRHGSRLMIAHSWKASYRLPSEGAERGDDIHQVDAETVLDKAVEAAREVSGGDIDHRLIKGGAVDSLVDLSRAADLIVVGSRGRGGFASMLLGSVAHAVASHAHCPTVIVR